MYQANHSIIDVFSAGIINLYYLTLVLFIFCLSVLSILTLRKANVVLNTLTNLSFYLLTYSLIYLASNLANCL